jgi:melanoma-associated antigen
VFDEANLRLQETFGMKLVELPVREKVTKAQKRAALKAEKSSTNSNSWILQSTLPQPYHDPDIIPPPRIPSSETESAYVGLYTFIISLISLSGGSLPDAKFERALRRTNTERDTPIGTTEDLMRRLLKDAYIVKIKDVSSGEEMIEYRVGPRGKVEVGDEGVAGFVREVYGDDAPDDLGKRLDSSLALGAKEMRGAQTESYPDAGASSRKGPGRRRKRDDREMDEEDDDDEEDEDEDESETEEE